MERQRHAGSSQGGRGEARRGAEAGAGAAEGVQGGVRGENEGNPGRGGGGAPMRGGADGEGTRAHGAAEEADDTGERRRGGGVRA